MQLTFAEAKALAVDVLVAHGMPADHAGIVGDHLVDAAGAGAAGLPLPFVLPFLGLAPST